MTTCSRSRILVVDDELPLRDAIAMKLTTDGFEVAVAANGAEAFERAVRSPFDLVLADYRMPELDGLDLCRRLLVHPRTTELPVLVMTTPWCTVSKQFAALDNVAGMLEKPFSLKALAEAVKQVLAECAARPASGQARVGC